MLLCNICECNTNTVGFPTGLYGLSSSEWHFNILQANEDKLIFCDVRFLTYIVDNVK